MTRLEGTERRAREPCYGTSGTGAGFRAVNAALAEGHEGAGVYCAGERGGGDRQNRAGGAVCARAAPACTLPVGRVRPLVYSAPTGTALRYGVTSAGRAVCPAPAG